MALFDAFTGNAQVEAQQAARDFLQDIRSETNRALGEGMNTGLGMIQGGIQPSLAALQGGFDWGNNAILGGTMWGGQSIYDMLGPSVDALGWGYKMADQAADQARGGVQEAWAPVQAAAAGYGKEAADAAALSRSGLGIDDPARARAAFQTSPGYEFMLGEGLEAIARNANRAGMVASGNQMRESQTYGSGLADKEWDDWMNRLMGREQLYAPLELQGKTAAGQGLSQAELSLANLLANAGVTTAANLGRSYDTAAGRLADMQSRAGTNIANLAQSLGQGQAGVWGTLGSQAQADFLRQLLGLQTQANTALAGGQAQTFIGQGDAEAQASKNIFDTIIGALGAATKAGAKLF